MFWGFKFGNPARITHFGGGGAPPPPPDYTRQRQRTAEQTAGVYRAQAKDYNNRLKATRRGLSNTMSRGRDAFAERRDKYLNRDYFVSGDNVRDPGSMSSFYDSLARGHDLSADRIMDSYAEVKDARPQFQSTITSYGAPVSVRLPNLLTPNKSRFQRSADEVRGYGQEVRGFFNDVTSDYNALSGFADDVGERASFLLDDAGQYGISDVGRLNNEIKGLRREVDSYDNPFGTEGLGRLGNTYEDALSGLSSRLDELKSDRQAEQQRINDFRSDLRGGLSSTIQEMRGLGDLDIGDQAGLDAREQALRDYENKLRGFSNRIEGFSSPLDTDFSRSQSLAGEAGSLLDQQRGTLEQLRGERQAAQDQIGSFRSNAMATLDDLSSRAGGLDITEIGQADALERELNSLRSRVNRFDSPLEADFSDVTGRFSNVTDALADVRDRRAAEEQRIADFRTGLTGASDQLRGQLNDLTIADAAGMDAAEQAIGDQVRALSRFESDLNPSFSGRLAEFRDLRDQLGNLRGEREAERARISRAQQSFFDQAGQLATTAGNIDPYSLDRIEQAQNTVGDLRSEIGGFSSALATDFGDPLSQLNAAEQALSGALSERGSALDAIQGRVSEGLQGLDAIDLSDESAFNERRAQLQEIGVDLGQFQGGRVENIQSQIDDALGQVDSRLQELDDKRAEIEQRAQAAYEALQDKSFTNLDALNDPFADRDALQEEMELFNAERAQEEIAQITERLNQERNRLQQDRENVLARERIGREEIEQAMGEDGSLSFDNFREVQPLTQEEFDRLVSQAEEEEEQGRDFATAFSRALGLTRR